jgi:hypothetical protein
MAEGDPVNIIDTDEAGTISQLGGRGGVLAYPGNARAIVLRDGRERELPFHASEIAPENTAVSGWGETGRFQRDEMGVRIVRTATCGACGRSWDDALGTSITPAPSARCPFEYEHDDDG